MSASELNTLGTWGTFIFTTSVSVLIVYRAASIRRALVDPLYRVRALWMAIAGVGLIGILVSTLIDGAAASGYGILANNNVAVAIEDVSWGLSFLALFGCVYSSVNVALASDYFHRDALRWTGGGKFVFAGTVLVGYSLASLPAPAAVSSSSIYGVVSNLIGIVFALATAYAAIVLLVTYRRIRDRAIRNYTKWLAVALGFVFAWIVGPDPYNFLAFIVSALCLYRATGALVIRTRDITIQAATPEMKSVP